ncbi:MAG: DNA polymerase III subunit delta [Chitinophagaceae bacterium]|nr:DNA polymerase III subunit delta [Anaerolineae bacterium]
MTNKTTPTFYIFHGEDSLTRDEAVKKLREAMGGDSNADLNISEFDGQVASVAEIVNAVTSYPFLSDKRLVIVKDLLAWLTRKGAGTAGKKGIEHLLEVLPTLPDYSRLVLIERETLSDKDKLVQLAEASPNGYSKGFTAPKDATGWIQKRAQAEYNIQIDNRAAAALAEVTGDDLQRADNELVKLFNYVAGERPITEADVAALTPYVPEANIFEMIDALAVGRGQQALHLLHRLMAEKDQDAFSLFGMIIRQFRLLLLAKEHLTTGGSPGSIAGALGIKPYPAQKLAQQSRTFNVEQLERILRSLLDFDVKMKTGRIDPDLALDLFVASVSK